MVQAILLFGLGLLVLPTASFAPTTTFSTVSAAKQVTTIGGVGGRSGSTQCELWPCTDADVNSMHNEHEGMVNALLREKSAYDRLLERHQAAVEFDQQSTAERLETEMKHRAILIARLECEAQSAVEATGRVLILEKHAYDRAKERRDAPEMKRRAPLVVRLEKELQYIQDSVISAMEDDDVDVETTTTNDEECPKIKAETTARALLASRLSMEAKKRDNAKKLSLASLKTAEEAKARALLQARLVMDDIGRKSASNTIQEEEEEDEALSPAEQCEIEIKQRALLVARLEMEQRTLHDLQVVISQQDESETMTETLSEDELAMRYGSIECLQERAFTILSDLGMVDTAPDPDCPTYDSSKDNVLVEA